MHTKNFLFFLYITFFRKNEYYFFPGISFYYFILITTGHVLNREPLFDFIDEKFITEFFHY
jgi:hypothetical protein